MILRVDIRHFKHLIPNRILSCLQMGLCFIFNPCIISNIAYRNIGIHFPKGFCVSCQLSFNNFKFQFITSIFGDQIIRALYCLPGPGFSDLLDLFTFLMHCFFIILILYFVLLQLFILFFLFQVLFLFLNRLDLSLYKNFS